MGHNLTQSPNFTQMTAKPNTYPVSRIFRNGTDIFIGHCTDLVFGKCKRSYGQGADAHQIYRSNDKNQFFSDFHVISPSPLEKISDKKGFLYGNLFQRCLLN